MESNSQNVCPWWMGYVLLIPIRKWSHHPKKLFENHVVRGMNVLDFGCAMGYFSLPLAKMTGENGKVYCVDIQEKMLEKLNERAKRAGVENIIEPLQVGKTFDPSKLQNQIDFAMLFAVVHEVDDKEELFKNLYSMLKTGAKVLFAEPKGHVSDVEFKKSILLAIDCGFQVSEEKPMKKGLSAFLIK
ncbi:MAG: class I SAM-dependent methyltransferase [Bacteroidales bacterium]|nr:class I SAM-dependent methyltransferase [Bacteroidales bacterium]